MKNGLLYKETLGKRKNIGDYIQSIAAKQFFDRIDEYIQQERVDEYKSDGGQTKVIMNGWYMSNPEHWPPSADIFPLFVSFHITPAAYDKMLTPEGVEYLKKYAPIGCRDIETQEVLLKKGIPAYFSACLTLTLGLKYKSREKSGEIIFVDPYYEFHRDTRRKLSIFPIGKAIITILVHYNQVIKISRNIEYHSYLKKERRILRQIERILRAACFYQSYRTKFSDELLFKAAFITHKLQPSFIDQRLERLEMAQNLVERYAKASLVVTSRIHAALPCLGLETPVLFVTPDDPSIDLNRHSTGRFKGLGDLFRILGYNRGGLVAKDEELRQIDKIGLDTKIFNKENYKSFQKDLFDKCKIFASF